MHPGIGHRVTPLQSLPVEIGIVGEAKAGPQVETDVLDPAFDFPLGLGTVRLAQLQLKAQPQGEVQHPQVPRHLAVLVLAQGHHLGVVIQAAPRHASQVLEGVYVALDEAGRVRPPAELHVTGPGPDQGYNEDPDPALLPVGPRVAQAAPVHLGLSPRLRLNAHGRFRLTTLTPGLRVGQQAAVAPIVALAPNLPLQHHAVLQTLSHPPVYVLGVGGQLRSPQQSRLRHYRLRGR